MGDAVRLDAHHGEQARYCRALTLIQCCLISVKDLLDRMEVYTPCDLNQGAAAHSRNAAAPKPQKAQKKTQESGVSTFGTAPLEAPGQYR